MSKDDVKINRAMMLMKKDQFSRNGTSSSHIQKKKLLTVGNKSTIHDLNAKSLSELEGEIEKEEIVAQDASTIVPKLLYELEVEIFARVPCFEYWKLQFLNKQFLQLLRSSDIFRVRQQRALLEPLVFMHSGGISPWTMFDKDFGRIRKLPEIPSDYCFLHSDKETISAGTHLIVIGRDADGIVVWRYELEMHKWFKGPSMITPRILYGSASRGPDAFFAGGIKIEAKWGLKVLSTAEKYNAKTKTWTSIQGLHKCRKFSSGCFLEGKFYVLGGRDENDKHLTCGESYDEKTNSWELIPNMLKGMAFKSSQSPPLIAVVHENLYMCETSLNELCVYNKKTNSWKKLGVVPVRANDALGWGVAFKSIGDKLLVIGPPASQSSRRTIVTYTCLPDPHAKQQFWQEIIHSCDVGQLHHFIHNCCVMYA